MAQAMRPPASPVGSVLSDTHSMNPWNGASSSILSGSEEGIGGRHALPRTSAPSTPARAGKDEWRRLCRRRQQPSLWRGGVAHRAGRRPGHGRSAMPAWGGTRALFGTNPIAAVFPRRDGPPLSIDMSLSEMARGKGAIPRRIPKPGSRARCCWPAAWRARCWLWWSNYW